MEPYLKLWLMPQSRNRFATTLHMCLHPNLLLGCYVFRTLASGVYIVEPWLSGCTVSICVCSHTGCRLDYHRVWTSDTCKTVSGAEGFFSRSGNAAHEAKYPLHCTPATKTLGTRCCADLFKVTQPFAKYLVVVGMKLPFSFARSRSYLMVDSAPTGTAMVIQLHALERTKTSL